MAKPEPKIWHEGRVYLLEWAMRSDGSMPAVSAIREMEAGQWASDPEAVAEGLPSDTQIKRVAVALERMRDFADYGEPERGGHMNALRDGIWEFKEGEKRFSFHDTPGDGTYSPKERIRYQADSPNPTSAFWDIPDFDDHLRIGHCFGKESEQRTTEEGDIATTLRVREEDLEHDREYDGEEPRSDERQ